MSEQREATVIIADWISGFAGGDRPLEYWLPAAVDVVSWLADEGHVITSAGPVTDVSKNSPILDTLPEPVKLVDTAQINRASLIATFRVLGMAPIHEPLRQAVLEEWADAVIAHLKGASK